MRRYPDQRLQRQRALAGSQPRAPWPSALRRERDRSAGARLLEALTTGYPAAARSQARQTLDLDQRGGGRARGSLPHPRRRTLHHQPRLRRGRRFQPPVKPVASGGATGDLSEIHRTTLPDGVRITLDLGSEVAYHQEEVGQARRVFFDLKNVQSATGLQDATLKYEDDVVKEIRLGRHPQNTVRVVLNLEGVASYSVYPLYNPYRLVVDAIRAAGVKPAAAAVPMVASLPAPLPARNEGRNSQARRQDPVHGLHVRAWFERLSRRRHTATRARQRGHGSGTGPDPSRPPRRPIDGHAARRAGGQLERQVFDVPPARSRRLERS